MRICVVTPRWAIAGVPLAQLRFARSLAKQGHQVDLIIGRRDLDLTIPETPEINLIVLQRKQVRGMLVPLVRYLRTVEPDVVFSAEDHLNGVVLLAAILSSSRAKISGSSRVSPFDSYSNKPFTRKWFAKQLMRAVMWRADALTCVSQDMVGQYRTIFPRGPHVCVYNIIDDDASRSRMAEPVDHDWFVRKEVPLIVAAGTLTGRKGFIDLIRAMKILHDRGHRARLAIFGEGYRRPELETAVAEGGLQDWVWLPGRLANPLKYFAQADISVLSSYAEGLPNVLVETMMCGCTPVATDCPTGPREVLQEGRYGYLVPMHDPAGLATGIAQAMERPIARERLAEAVLPFEERAVIRRHFEVLGITEPA